MRWEHFSNFKMGKLFPLLAVSVENAGASGKTRTLTLLPEPDFESVLNPIKSMLLFLFSCFVHLCGINDLAGHGNAFL